MFKLEWMKDGEWEEYSHPPVYAVQARPGASERLVATAPGSDPQRQAPVRRYHARTQWPQPSLCRAERAPAVPIVRERVGTVATIYADEGSAWDELHAGWDTKRVNHSIAYMDDGVCTNQAESYFSRLRRAEIGTHHHIAGPYLNAYATEMSRREDNRRVSNGHQAAMVTAAVMAATVSRQWKGYWQRAA